MCVLLFNVETVIYSLVFAVVYSVAMDKVHIQNINVEVTIITKADTYIIEQWILEELGRGITKCKENTQWRGWRAPPAPHPLNGWCQGLTG